jgi:tetratricopeptide (TPR) repeat protein
MERDLMRRPTLPMNLGGVDWAAAAVWLGGFALVAYLGLRGGGYDPLIHDSVGIGIWWVLLAAVAVAAVPRHRPGPVAWAALGLFFAYVCWTALSLAWTESIDKTWAEVARALGYLGVLAFAVLAGGPDRARTLIGAVSAGIVLVAAVALLSRVHADWFPEASQTARFLADGRERLSYPLNYWNALGALIAIGLPLTLSVATTARSLLLRAAAAAALPALALALFLTLSRGGIAAAALAIAAFFALADDRLPKALTAAVAAAGAAFLILAADSRDAFQHAFFSPAGERQGDEMAPIVLLACLAVGLLQALVGLGLDRGLRPRWTRPSRRQSLVGWGAILVVALIAAAAVDLPGRTAEAWDEFKQGDVPSAGTARLQTLSGESRYELWEAALDQNASAPLAGTGAGTYEYWWARNGGPEVVRDAHSLYLQVLGELGIVGFLLLVAFLLVVLLGGGTAALRGNPARAAPAAALAGLVAFCLTAAVDWVWQVPVVPVAALLLAGAVVSQRFRDRPDWRGLTLPWRLGFAALAIAAIVAIAIPLASATLLRSSEDAARGGDLGAALADARSAQNVQPGAAAPRLQEALVLEAQGQLPTALAAAEAAAEREGTNWRNWLVLARIEAESGMTSAAVRDYRKAEALNPHFSLFSR